MTDEKKQLPYGHGSIKKEGDKFVARLPRALSRKKAGLKNKGDFRERLGAFDTWEQAADVLVNAVKMRQAKPADEYRGIPFATDAESTLKRIKSDALRRYSSEAQANRRVSTSKGILTNWLGKESWLKKPTALVTHAELQATINWIAREGRTLKDKPVSSAFIRSIVGFLRAVFEDRGIEPNPVLGLKLPPKKEPEVPYWSLREQENLFRCADIPERDRVMAGCGMGLGLRKGELLALEFEDVNLDDHSPHIEVRHGGPDRSPVKGNKKRRVELFEPGLGFLRIWMAEFYQDTQGGLVFAGPLGGYQKAWPEQFPTWGELARLRHSHSHMMRHTYAVSVLSGTWGYEPQSLEFVGDQLGHADQATTERYYGAFETETWRRQVSRMTGREERPTKSDVVTAAKLLGRSTGRKGAKRG